MTQWPNIAQSMRTVFALALVCSATAHPILAQTAPPPAVVTAPAEMTPLTDSITFTGRMVAVRKVAIRARVTGFLEKIEFQDGDLVEEGEVLFEIEPDNYQAALDQIDGQIRAAEAQRELAELNRDRQAELVRREATPQSQLDQAIAEVGVTEGELLTLAAEKRKAELNLSYTQIQAPFAGLVGTSVYDEGAYLGSNADALVKVTQMDPIYAEFAVPSAIFLDFQQQIRDGKASRAATVSLQRSNGSMYDETGRVTFVDTEVAEGTDTIMVRATFSNSESYLKDGELVRVILAESEAQEVLAIPAQAIGRDMAGSFVMVVGDDSVTELRRVSTGVLFNGMMEIRGGLEAGEHVITQGMNKVRPGATVDAAPASATAPTGKIGASEVSE
ncbi:MAG: efflux RND transporter periplasmic adaptor subunit [Mangrovicoccus sp.]